MWGSKITLKQRLHARKFIYCQVFHSSKKKVDISHNRNGSIRAGVPWQLPSFPAKPQQQTNQMLQELLFVGTTERQTTCCLVWWYGLPSVYDVLPFVMVRQNDRRRVAFFHGMAYPLCTTCCLLWWYDRTTENVLPSVMVWRALCVRCVAFCDCTTERQTTCYLLWRFCSPPQSPSCLPQCLLHNRFHSQHSRLHQRACIRRMCVFDESMVCECFTQTDTHTLPPSPPSHTCMHTHI